ncbi:MAG: InlB B-repeat-containing protein, partial [Oscillospiraceae bacterium]|nr:InlB B-repeat-containing protein [Oscillospiraceae bacterium]
MLRAAETALSFSHTRPNGEDCFTAFQGSYRAFGENIAAGQSTGSSVFTSWQEENEKYAGQGHRRNMLSSNFNAIGIGHVYYNGTHYWVQEFGYTPSPDVNAAQPSESTETVTLEVLPSNISNLALSCSKKALSMDAGESMPLPDVSLTVSVTGHWPYSQGVPVRSYGNTESALPKWTCTNTDIAAVNPDGTITAIAAGKATLTAACSDLTASCEVTVRPASGSGQNNNNADNGPGSTSSSIPYNGQGSGSDDKTQDEYVIIFDPNEGYLNGSGRMSTYSQKIASFPDAYRTGYRFNGWYTQPAGGYKVTAETIFSKNTTIYAHWDRDVQDFEKFSYESTETTALLTADIPSSYVLTWQAAFGTSEYSQPETRTMDCYETTGTLKVLLQDLKPGTVYYYYIEYTTNDGRIKSDVMTFTTKKAVEYTVNFNGNGGSVTGQSSMVTAGQRLAMLPDARREGFSFDGWYTEKSGGDQISAATIFDKNSTVYAHWKSTVQEPAAPEIPTDQSLPGQTSDPASPVPGNNAGNDTGQESGSTATVPVKKVQLKNAKNSGKGKLTVKWKSDKNSNGYRIAYST